MVHLTEGAAAKVAAVYPEDPSEVNIGSVFLFQANVVLGLTIQHRREMGSHVSSSAIRL